MANLPINQLQLRCIEHDLQCKLFTFNLYIDGQALDQRLGFDRQSDLRFSDFDLDLFAVDQQRFPNYDRQRMVRNKVAQFTGEQPIVTQLENNRLVLYRCHCGSDYCSVISCALETTNTQVIWRDIGYEDGLDTEDALELDEQGIMPITQLTFAKADYMQVFADYLRCYL